ncbi:hypothetical protein, variant 2, partial [Phytophthora nicotianae]
TLELLDCRALTFSGWPRDAVALRKVFLNGCNFVTNQAASSLITVCGDTLEKIIFTEATSLDSQIFRDLARHAQRLEELTIKYADSSYYGYLYTFAAADAWCPCSFDSDCTSVRLRDFQALTEALWSSLRWLDLASCRGISSFPDATSLPQLQVLILDKTKINDDGLRGISQVATSLRYLSLQVRMPLPCCNCCSIKWMTPRLLLMVYHRTVAPFPTMESLLLRPRTFLMDVQV